MDSVTIFAIYIGLGTLIPCLGLGAWLHRKNKQRQIKREHASA